MCGIAGIFSTDRIDRTIVEAMTTALKHRGPDAQGIFLDPTQTIAFGHRRLSIIDLSEEANQPFHSGDRRFVVTFNGEIYNFKKIRKELQSGSNVRFRTNSDTEVIVEAFVAWGVNMAEKLEGMFAIGIADLQKRRLYLFRDRLGKKPLFYFQSQGLFAFASEMKSLLEHPLIQHQKINAEAVSAFLHLGYIPSPHTIYDDIRKFPAGHYGEIDDDMPLNTAPFWDLKSKLDLPRVDDASEAKRRLGELLDDAVQQRLISDVPLGAFLSGGTDSSLVCAIAAKHVSKPLKTFSIGFKEARFDESQYARAVAAQLKTDHTEFVLSEKVAVEEVGNYLNHFDEPFADTSAIPTMLVSKLARREVKVVLTGDGGDELFQGYGSYAWANRMDRWSWKMLKGPLGWAFRSSGNSRLERISHLLETPHQGGLRSHIFSQEQYYFTQDEICDKLLRRQSDFRPFEYNDNPMDRTAAEKQSLFDLQFYLPDDLLAKVDRSSMYYALECRCPLLDHRVVEYALSLTEELKRKGDRSKWIEKELLSGYLPAELIDRPKRGFSIPLASWLKGDLRYLLEDHLADAKVDEAGICQVHYVQKLKRDFFAGKEYLYHRLWVLIVLHKWIAGKHG